MERKKIPDMCGFSIKSDQSETPRRNVWSPSPVYTNRDVEYKINNYILLFINGEIATKTSLMKNWVAKSLKMQIANKDLSYLHTVILFSNILHYDGYQVKTCNQLVMSSGACRDFLSRFFRIIKLLANSLVCFTSTFLTPNDCKYNGKLMARLTL